MREFSICHAREMGRKILILLVGVMTISLSAATLPAGFTESLVTSGLSSPTSMAVAPDGRIFVCEQGGALRVIKNGALLPTPFLSLSVNSLGERGLLGVEFDPNFATNQYIYVFYTTSSSPIHNRVSRFTANGDVAVSGSELPLLDLDALNSATNHNGGAIRFGPDGYLYVAQGENAIPDYAQSLTIRFGKILRIASDGSIPVSNPFYGSTTITNRSIWALGLRNPFTFAFQPGTGRLFLNDVGQNSYEEINEGFAGANYGWPATEGPTANPNFTPPLFSYGHGSGPTTGCAISGGVFYNPQTQQFPASYLGKYLFADFCSGWIRVLDPATATASAFATGISFPVDLRIDGSGRLLYLERGTGSVKRIESTQSPTDRLGIFRGGFFWLLDVDGNTQFAVPPDRAFAFGGLAGDVPIRGDWNGDGRSKVGIYRSATGTFLLDLDGDFAFTANDRVVNLGVGTQQGDVPLSGDWNGDGTWEVGLFRQGYFWILDSNGSGVFEQGVDSTFAFGGVSGDIPVVGDWDGEGRSKIGLFRQGFYWILDRNGNGQLDSVNLQGGDAAFPFGGLAGDVPVVGDWSGDMVSKVGVFRAGFLWVLDKNGNKAFDDATQDQVSAFGGITGDRPLTGKW